MPVFHDTLHRVSLDRGQHVWGLLLTSLGLFRCAFLDPVHPPAVQRKVLGVFFDLSTLSLSVRPERGIANRECSYRTHSYLLLVAASAEPEPIVQVVPSLTAPFLPTDASSDVLHVEQDRALLVTSALS